MMIVASNSITVSNVNDGTTVHIAYANSADGKDGFYVGGGRNYLADTGTPWKTQGSGVANQVSPNKLFTFGTINQAPFKDGEYVTLSFDYTSVGTGAYGTIQPQFNSTPWDQFGGAEAMKDNGHVVRTVQWQSGWATTDVVGTAIVGYATISNANGIQMRMDNVATTRTVTVYNMQFELGNKDTGWSPAPSEAHPTYMGTYTDYTQADSLDPTAYQWSQIKGADGKDGVGIRSTIITYQLSSSGTTTPTGIWSTTVPTLTKGQYLWTRTTLAYTDNTTEDVYSVSYVAKDGNNGTDGVAGKDGVGIQSTTITYQASTSGTTAPSGTWVANPPSVTGGSYLWTRTVWNYTDGTSEIGYSVAKAGEKGDKGDTGATGKDGVAGKDGVGIKSTQIMYAQSTSGTTAPTTGWTAQVPTLIKGQYLWTQTTWVYTDNTGEAGYTVSYNAKDGNTGANGVAGKDGVGIKSTTITYASSTSGTTAPTSGWTVTPPAASAGQYMWTKTVWTYTDGTNETGYSVGKIGEKGDKGDSGTDGLPGKDGVGIQSTTITYQASTSGTTAPTGTWVTIPPTVAVGNFLWTRMIWTYTDGTNETGYSVGHIGADGSDGLPGKAGADGRTPYFHQAWADSPNDKATFSTTVSLGKKYLGTYTDYVVADSQDPTKYKWTELVGAIEIGGTNLLLNTGDLSANWTGQFSVSTTVEYNGHPSTVFTSSTQQLVSQNLNLGKLQNSTQYTASFWAKADNTGDKAHTELWGSEGATDFVLTNDWVRYTAVLTSDSDANTNVSHSACYFGVPSGNKGNVYIALPKLEHGNKATDWSPAPEDNASASELSTVVTQTAKNWSVLAQGMGGTSAGISVDGDGTVHIDGDKLSIGSDLIAKDITGKNITGSTFANDTGTFSIDTAGNIKGAIISGSNIELANLDTPDGTKKGFLESDGLLLQEDYKNATEDYHVVHTDVGSGWSGLYVRSNHKDDSYDYAGINALGVPNLYVSRHNSNGDMTSYITLDYNGISSTMLDSSGKYKNSTLSPDQIIQLSKVGHLLWSGASYMHSTQTVTPSLKLNECLNGWLLEWQLYANGAPNNTDIMQTPIFKSVVNAHSGKGFSVDIGIYQDKPVRKYLYPTLTNIKGTDANNTGIAHNFVLTSIYAF